MIEPARRLAYTLGQGLRISWFFGQAALAARLTGPTFPAGAPKPRRHGPGWPVILKELAALSRRDLANIESGLYRMPEDLLPPPSRMLADARLFIEDLPAVRERRRQRAGNELRRNPPADLPRLPRYYLQNFHFQTDGYLSDRSAALYDHQVEALFGGAADAMRRQALLPLGRHLRTHGSTGRRLLDIGAGTGRFLAEIKRNWPRLDVTALDLSLPYLRQARQTLGGWRAARAVLAPAETLPFADGSLDLVTSVFLFHELPRAIRMRTAREIARVLTPGGMFVLVDSLQTGDRPDLDGLLALFPQSFHEPYYNDYLRHDLVAAFADAGLVIEGKDQAFLSKLLIFRKGTSTA